VREMIARRHVLALTALGTTLGASSQSGCAEREARSTTENSAAQLSAQPVTYPIILSGNENPYGPGPKARAAIANSVAKLARYNVDSFSALIGALASATGTPRNQLLLGAGSGELLHMLALDASRRGEVLSAWPAYGQLMTYAESLGAKVRRVPLDSAHRHDLSAMAAAVGANTALVYVCNPNNPTGTVVGSAALSDFCRQTAARALVVVDEAYIDLAEPGATQSMLELARTSENVVVLGTFSKTHGLAGLRIGYAVGGPRTIERLRKLQMTYPNTVGLEAARASLDDTDFLERCRSAIRADRARIVAACRARKLEFAEPHGNFVFVRTGVPIQEFRARMQAERIEVGRPFEPYVDWVRITVGTTRETDALLTALNKVLG
jgi:histidinol-phosphate aminotransferase